MKEPIMQSFRATSLFVSFLVLLVCQPSANAQVCNAYLFPNQLVPVPLGTNGLLFGDLNGDGIVDLVTDGVSVMMGNGDGTFAPPVSYAAVDHKPFSLVDLNNDGALDIFVMSFQSGSSVYLNDGDGLFTFSSALLIDGQTPRLPLITDFDNDGDLDIAQKDTLNDEMVVLLNNGDGTFATETRYTTGLGLALLVQADLDNDGDADFMTYNTQSDDHSIFMNNGDGTFADEVRSDIDEDLTGFTLKDLNGDNTPDLISTHFTSTLVSVSFNNGDGTFGVPAQYESNGGPRLLAPEDIDNDGDLDIVVVVRGSTTLNTRLIVLRNDGNGVFATQDTYFIGPLIGGGRIVDLDADGDLDIAFTGLVNSEITVYQNNGDGIFAPQAPYPVSTDAGGFQLADVNNDGFVDMTVSAAGNFIRVLFGSANGTFSSESRYPVTENTTQSCFRFGDLDGDGDLDIVMIGRRGSTSPRELNLLFNNGDGSFPKPVTMALPDDTYHIEVKDMDGDGDADIVMPVRSENSVRILFNDGNGVFNTEADVEAGALPGEFVVGDLDGDGDFDIAAVTSSSLVSVLRSNGDGTFAPPFTFGSNQSEHFTLGDLDGDGDLDLAAIRRESGQFRWRLNNGNAIFGPLMIQSFPGNPNGFSLNDLDGDGDLDVSVSRSGNNGVVLLLNDGGASFGSQVNIPIGESYFGMLAGDLDGDGDTDLALQTSGNNPLPRLVRILFNDGNANFDSQIELDADYTFSDRLSLRGLADLSGDGYIDIIASRSSDGFVVFHNQTCSPAADCPADLQPDGVLDIFDILAFLDAFNTQDPLADINTDGEFNIFDILAFLDVFNLGCP